MNLKIAIGEFYSLPFTARIAITYAFLFLALLINSCTSLFASNKSLHYKYKLAAEQQREYLGPDLWELVENDYQFAPEHYNNRLVKRYVAVLKTKPDFLNRLNERSSLFLYHIRKELNRRNMPAEFALLPAVESGYDPYAYSPAGASGLWQFIEETGIKFGLDNEWWYSDRRDFEESTTAALDYLEYLYEKYGDWEISLAAYNAGERRVNKAIRYNQARGRPTNYWALSALPRETENYVPQLIAYSYIFTKEQREEIGLRTIPAQNVWAKVPVERQVPLAEIIDLARLDEEKFYLLNAGHNQWVTSPYKEHLYVPIEEYPRLRVMLDSFVADAPLWVSYQLQRQDTLVSVADSFNLTEDSIREFNRVDLLKPGNYLVLPVASAEITPYHRSDDPPRYLVKNESVKAHKIKRGDNLSSISRTYRVSVANLQRMNDINNPHQIRAGQSIVVNANNKVKNPSILLAEDYNRQVMRTVYYRVRRGDNLYRIASKFNVGINQIKEWNPGKSLGNIIYPGAVVKLQLDVTDL